MNAEVKVKVQLVQLQYGCMKSGGVLWTIIIIIMIITLFVQHLSCKMQSKVLLKTGFKPVFTKKIYNTIILKNVKQCE